MIRLGKMVLLCTCFCLFLAGCGSKNQEESNRTKDETMGESADQSVTEESLLEESETMTASSSDDVKQSDHESIQESSIKGSADEAWYLENADKYVDMMVKQDYAALNTDFDHDEAMQKMLDDGSLKIALAPSLTALGQLESKEQGILETVSGYVSVSVPCIFKNDRINIVIFYDQEQKIAGASFDEYKSAADTGTISETEVTNDNVREEELSFMINTGQSLSGTLTLPLEGERFPVVILVHGSGSSDRNEAVNYLTPFRDIAWGLAEQGVAVYRYDKRTYLYKDISEDFTIYDETIDDVAAAVEMIKEQEQIDPDQVYILGHSLGATVMSRIAEVTDQAGYIMMAPLAKPLLVTMKEQMEYLAALDQTVTAEEQAAIDEIGVVIDRINQPEELDMSQAILGAYPKYWIDLENYNPVEDSKNIQKPVLLLQGDQDYQVTVENYDLWKAAFSESDNWEFKLYPGLNHMFIEGTLENGPLDYQKDERVSDQVITDIGNFIKSE